MRLIALFLLMGMVFLSAPAAHADAPPTTDVSLRSLGYNDIELFGLNTVADIFVPGPGDVAVGNNSTLRFQFSHTALARPEISTLTVRFNRSVVYQTFLTPANATRFDVQIPIPSEIIEPDANRIQAIFYIRLPNDYCDSADNPAKTAAVHNITQVKYDIASREPLPQPVDLGKFPLPFLRTSSSTAEEVNFVLPAQPTANDLSAAATVAARIGQLAGTKVLTTNVSLGATLADSLKGRNIIVVGQPSRLFDDLTLPVKVSGTTFQSPNGGQIGPDDGVIQVAPAPGSTARQLLVVSGGGPAGVQKAASTLASATAFKALSGPYAVVNQAAPNQRSANGESLATQKLSELGYRETTMVGIGTRTLAFAFQSAVPGSDAELELSISHSPLLNPNKSSIKVLLNNVAVTSLPLTKDNTSRSTIRVPISARALKGGQNNVTIEFNMYVAGDADCGPLADERSWAVVHGDSAFIRPARATGNVPSLSDYPFPFVDDGTTADTILVIPDGNAGVSAALQFAADLGRSMREDFGRIAVLHEGEVGEAVREKNLVLLGLPETSPLQQQATAAFPFQFDGPFDRVFKNNNDVQLVIRDARRVGAVQVGRSPWNANRAVLAIAAQPNDSMSLALTALRLGDLTGNLVIATDTGPGTPAKISGFDFRPRQTTRRTLIENRDLIAIGAGAASGALALIVLGALAIQVVRKR